MQWCLNFVESGKKMAWFLNLIQLMTMGLVAIFLSPSQSSFEGRVIDQSGAPLQTAQVLLVKKGAPDVEVGNFTNTDESGTFHFESTPDALFVQKKGYLPQLYRVDGTPGNPLVVMNPVASYSNNVPTCIVTDTHQRLLRVGLANAITLGARLSAKTTRGVDTSLVEISYRKNPREVMSIASGMFAIVNHPNVAALAYTKEIIVRPTIATDISGTTADGKRWRWMFSSAGHIEYYDASAKAAESFDRAIDSLCRNPQ
jgi:Carboxypeptidase regulatory-like domain